MIGFCMKNAFLFTIILIVGSFTGCILENDDDDDSPSLRESVNSFINSMNTQNWNKFCSYHLDYEATFMNSTEKKECIDEWESDYDEAEEYGLVKLRTTTDNYRAEKLDYKASKTSGYVYSVSMSVTQCFTYSDEGMNGTEDENCEYFDEEDMLWAEVSGKWGYGQDGFEGYYQSGSSPIATFTVESSSGGEYYVKVVKVTKQEDLTKFSYFLKDDTESTYVGGNGFGEVAMQMIAGEEHGIERTYNGDDAQLESRAGNVSADDGTDYPVQFNDNDRDGKLSAGDQFTVYGSGNAANGPAQSGWKLDIQFDASGDIIGWGEIP